MCTIFKELIDPKSKTVNQSQYLAGTKMYFKLNSVFRSYSNGLFNPDEG